MIGTSRKPVCANHYDSGYPEISGNLRNVRNIRNLRNLRKIRNIRKVRKKNSYSAIQIVTRFLSFSLNGCTREPFEL